MRQRLCVVVSGRQRGVLLQVELRLQVVEGGRPGSLVSNEDLGGGCLDWLSFGSLASEVICVYILVHFLFIFLI